MTDEMPKDWSQPIPARPSNDLSLTASVLVILTAIAMILLMVASLVDGIRGNYGRGTFLGVWAIIDAIVLRITSERG